MSLSDAPATSSCFFIFLRTSSSIKVFSFIQSTTSESKLAIFSLLAFILEFPRFSSSSMKFFCISTLSKRDSFLSSKVFTSSRILRIFSLITVFIEENIFISNKSSITSLRCDVGSCMKGTKALDPNITICVNDL